MAGCQPAQHPFSSFDILDLRFSVLLGRKAYGRGHDFRNYLDYVHISPIVLGRMRSMIEDIADRDIHLWQVVRRSKDLARRSKDLRRDSVSPAGAMAGMAAS